MPVLTVEKSLLEKLGDDGVDSLVRLINDSRDEQKRDIVEFVGERFERRLSEEIGGLELRLTEKMSNLETRLTEKIEAGDKELADRINNVDKRLSEKFSMLDVKISQSNANMIKWMFIFWVGQVGVILGMLFAFFK